MLKAVQTMSTGVHAVVNPARTRIDCRPEAGRVDLLVNNDGIGKQVRFSETSLEGWELILRTSLTGAFVCLRAAGRRWTLAAVSW